MSGGVDSSVAACLLRDAGYECIGAFIRVGAHAAHADGACRIDDAPSARPAGSPPRRLRHGCCSADDALDARAVAGRLDIPFYALNLERDFNRIIDYFVDEYANARTPNPCVMCNIHVKFGRLMAYADLMDAEFVATGHYARVIQRDACPSGSTALARSLNAAKDQSYVLAGIRREALPRCLFPLGEITDKAQVRRMAAELGLRVHDKPDSQEICFVPENDYRRLLKDRRPDLFRAGEIVDQHGRVLGEHAGVAAFTIGQRRGLGIAAGEPIYVTRLNVLDNRVTVGPRDALAAPGLHADRVNWLIDPPSSDGWRGGEAKIRHLHAAAPARWRTEGHDNLEVRFTDLQDAVTPGQAVVIYEGDIVAAGAWIREAISD